MDDRKNKIKELERTIYENQSKLNTLLEDLGKAILCRPGIEKADAAVFPDIDEYQNLQKEIADSDDSIKNNEKQIARSRFLEEEIEGREQQNKAYLRDLAGYYSRMGKLVLEEPALGSFSLPYRRQADILIPKVQSLEDRLSEL